MARAWDWPTAAGTSPQPILQAADLTLLTWVTSAGKGFIQGYRRKASLEMLPCPEKATIFAGLTWSEEHQE